MKEEKQKISPEMKEIIIHRIESSKLPENIRLSVGGLSQEPMSLQEVVRHVENEDEIGEKIIEMEVAYLEALKEGIISKIQNE